MSTFDDELKALNRTGEDINQRFDAYHSKHGLEEGTAVLPDSPELRQLVADQKAYNEAMSAFVARYVG